MDVSINMKELAASLSGKLETLPPLSEECSIYRVPEPQRRLNPSHYTPQMVSIGPFHHGKPKLKAMEEHKQRYLKHFLQRTKVRMANFLAFIKKRETRVRNCYAETIRNLGSDEFVVMVLVDAAFLIELFLRYYGPADWITDDDRIFGKPQLHWRIWHDLWLVENQLPLFILIDLFDLAQKATNMNTSFSTISCPWFNYYISSHLPIKKDSLKLQFSRAKHFLDLIIFGLHQQSQSRDRTELKDLNIPSVKELHQAGVKLKPAAGPTINLLNITFDEDILEIPFLTLYDSTERLYRNLLAFESMHGYPGYFNDYIIMMNYLVNTPKDAELLYQNNITGLGNIETLATIFRNLDKDCGIDNLHFRYAGTVADLQCYSKLRWHRWKANLKQNYFNTPWASISILAAVILLLLTATQTVSSLIAL